MQERQKAATWWPLFVFADCVLADCAVANRLGGLTLRRVLSAGRDSDQVKILPILIEYFTLRGRTKARTTAEGFGESPDIPMVARDGAGSLSLAR
ncbi:MAG TPA: hypothetical protein VFU55_09605 [Terracidiphilus sp.]|nr:hypothetical protein [Terracidiphilus sp.]